MTIEIHGLTCAKTGCQAASHGLTTTGQVAAGQAGLGGSYHGARAEYLAPRSRLLSKHPAEQTSNAIPFPQPALEALNKSDAVQPKGNLFPRLARPKGHPLAEAFGAFHAAAVQGHAQLASMSLDGDPPLTACLAAVHLHKRGT